MATLVCFCPIIAIVTQRVIIPATATAADAAIEQLLFCCRSKINRTTPEQRTLICLVC
jgi:hypothetical protein